MVTVRKMDEDFKGNHEMQMVDDYEILVTTKEKEIVRLKEVCSLDFLACFQPAKANTRAEREDGIHRRKPS